MSCHGHHLGFDRTGNSAIPSADPKNPTLEPNTKLIGRPVPEISSSEDSKMAKFKGHVTPNIKNRPRKNLDIVLEYHNSLLIFFDLMYNDKGDFEIGYFRNFRTSVTLTLTLDRVIWHTVV